MNRALDEGEELANDLCESQLFSLVKDKNFQAIKYRLDKRHPKYRKVVAIEAAVPLNIQMDRIIEELNLVADDFLEENYGRTLVRIAEYLKQFS